MKYIKIVNQTHPASQAILAKYCQSFFCQLRGLMFTNSLPDNYGLLLVQGSDSRVNSSIHMMFMWMDLAVIWINSEYMVVDLVIAHRWKFMYLPKEPARYVLETGVSNLSNYNIGDKVRYEEISRD
ncbi:MAG: hypothetical protein A2029_16275 [Chloroflexi bacterium RBG_19FT_COMBO_47_9]|nr:MAG: hypothetical protein A2029_16275 [Chloroflexi bacterium RBG_19FT_COMBO_47_9]